jgi:WD40 repeat protein
VLVWDLEKNTVVNTLEGHNAAISQITFSKGGEFMATASLDGTAHVWQLEDLNEQPIELRDHDNWVVSVAFSPDAQNVYTGTSGQSIKVYPLNVEAMASRICNNPNLNRTSFKPEEWEKFVGKDLELQETCK